MTLLRLCHILDAWRNFIRLDVFLTSGGNFKTPVGGNGSCSSFFGSQETSWKTDERLGWGILPPNSRQIARLQIHTQHLFWWHLSLIKCHLLKSGKPSIGIASPSRRSVYCCPLRASASCQPALSSPACTVPSSRNSSKSHLRINPIINTFVGVRLKVML